MTGVTVALEPEARSDHIGLEYLWWTSLMQDFIHPRLSQASPIWQGHIKYFEVVYRVHHDPLKCQDGEVKQEFLSSGIYIDKIP